MILEKIMDFKVAGLEKDKRLNQHPPDLDLQVSQGLGFEQNWHHLLQLICGVGVPGIDGEGGGLSDLGDGGERRISGVDDFGNEANVVVGGGCREAASGGGG